MLDPAFAPATGTPEAGGFSSRELLGILSGLRGTNLVGADIVEVAPAYDHADITSIDRGQCGLRASVAHGTSGLTETQPDAIRCVMRAVHSYFVAAIASANASL